MNNTAIPWSIYPRPQLRRDSCLILNGQWDFALISEGEAAPEAYPDCITVPFCPESHLSGLRMPILPHQVMYYRKKFHVPAEFLSDCTLLHFGAVDQICDVYMNQRKLGSHAGGYLPFSFEVTDAVTAGENELTVVVTDPLDHDLPWGKQKYQRGGMWYTPVSGIWQTVWMESFSLDAVRSLQIRTTLEDLFLTVETDANVFTLEIPEIGYCKQHTEKEITLQIPEPHHWSVNDPHLYEFSVTTENDRVESYFGLRTIEAGKDENGIPRIFLNKAPIFLHGVLDQGYFEDGIYTPQSPDAYENDIRMLKDMGFNTLRKHIKVEPAVFYSLCDHIGMLVMQDFVNTGEYSFFRDTALPTIGMISLPDTFLPRSRNAKAYFMQNALGTQRLLYNSPSVIAYTIFNEGWGQFSADRVYEYLKSQDPSRLYDATSGWFQQKKSDFDSRHVYFRKLRLKAKKRPLFLSEFGGYAYREPEHSFSKGTYGYRVFSSHEELQKAVSELYENEVIPLVSKGLCGAIYTQLSDVEDEINGLVTYDRKVQKLSTKKMMEIAIKLKIQ